MGTLLRSTVPQCTVLYISRAVSGISPERLNWRFLYPARKDSHAINVSASKHAYPERNAKDSRPFSSHRAQWDASRGWRRPPITYVTNSYSTLTKRSRP